MMRQKTHLIKMPHREEDCIQLQQVDRPLPLFLLPNILYSLPQRHFNMAVVTSTRKDYIPPPNKPVSTSLPTERASACGGTNNETSSLSGPGDGGPKHARSQDRLEDKGFISVQVSTRLFKIPFSLGLRHHLLLPTEILFQHRGDHRKMSAGTIPLKEAQFLLCQPGHPPEFRLLFHWEHHHILHHLLVSFHQPPKQELVAEKL